MALQVNVGGATLIKVDTGSGDALESLGYTINGTEETWEAFMENVPGDQKGGDQGPPIDVQYFGDIIRIRMELSKYDPLVAAKVEARRKGATGGSVPTAGTLMFGESKAFRLVLVNTNSPINFPRAILRSPINFNRGSKFSRLILEWECHELEGTLYNTTIV